MAEIFNLTGIELVADNSDQAKVAKQYLINIIRKYGITASDIIRLNEFANENDDTLRTVINTLKKGGSLKSIALPLIQKAMSGGLGKTIKK